MIPILIIKTGSTFPEIKTDRGDFEDWIINGMGIERRNFSIIDVSAGESLPDRFEYSGIIIPGSHAMVTERLAWSERTAAWIPRAIEQRIPMLGICYGHQLIAHALGGTVDYNPNGLEFGTAKIHFTKAAQNDPLFSVLPEEISFQVSHSQSVISLPNVAKLLAFNEMEPHHAFRYSNHVWGIQFHPEFDADITRRYIRLLSEKLEAKGLDPEELSRRCFDTPFGSAFLKRFAEIILE